MLAATQRGACAARRLVLKAAFPDVGVCTGYATVRTRRVRMLLLNAAKTSTCRHHFLLSREPELELINFTLVSSMTL